MPAQVNKLRIAWLTCVVFVVASCSGDSLGPEAPPPPTPPPPPTGTLQIRVSTTGSSIDPDGYDLSCGSIGPIHVNVNDEVTFGEVRFGTAWIKLEGISESCWLESDDPKTVPIEHSGITTTEIDVICADPWTPPFSILLENGGTVYELTDGGRELTWIGGGGPASRPVPSPDGSRIALYLPYGAQEVRGDMYAGYVPSYRLSVTKRDGTDPIRLSTKGGHSAGPAPVWSRDGSLVAAGLHIYDTSGSEVERTTFSTDLMTLPITIGGFSPNGDRIVYADSQGIAVWDRDDETETDLGSGSDAVLSPDGRRIAFDLDGDIYTMNADGSGRRNLTHTAAEDDFPVWSPDGALIAFESIQGDVREIHVVRADGSGTWPLTLGRAGDMRAGSTATRPVWSPDGQWLMFVRRWGWKNDVYAVARDGHALYNLTHLLTSYYRERRFESPAWLP